MSLTPEDVVNKRFSPTKFREGYDQDEVDDFLDEVVLELRRLGQENEELRQRLITAGARSVAVPAAASVAAPVPTIAPAGVGGFEQSPLDAGNTSNLLQLARRLHEEHVREGMEKRDALIAEGQAAAAKAVADAESVMRAQNGALVQERETLERRIAQLRAFETDYRRRLRGYIETQLRELSAGSILGDPAQQAPTAAPAAAPAPAAAAPAAPAAPAPTAVAPAAPAPVPSGFGAPQPFGAPVAAPAPFGGGFGAPQPVAPQQTSVALPAQPAAQPASQPLPGYTPGAMPQIPAAPAPQAPQPSGLPGLGGQ